MDGKKRWCMPSRPDCPTPISKIIITLRVSGRSVAGGSGLKAELIMHNGIFGEAGPEWMEISPSCEESRGRRG